MTKMKDLAPHFLQVTEQAAIASGKFRGCGDKNKADDAAVNAMRNVFKSIPVHARVAIGEGEMDEAPMLYIGEELGQGLKDSSMMQVDIAVDPLECTSHCAYNLPNSMCVIAVAPRGALLHTPECYMDKIAGATSLRGHISLNKSVKDNVLVASKILNKPVSQIKVIILDRPRNYDKIKELKKMEVEIDFIQNGDIVGALRAVDGDADLLMGIGSAPEGVITATAVKGLKGIFEGKLYFHKISYKENAEKVLGENANKIWNESELCTSNNALFVATGVCDGWLPGVKFEENIIKTWSKLIYVESGEIKTIKTIHN
jgi:fructose-1,6-bisphosphatase class II